MTNYFFSFFLHKRKKYFKKVCWSKARTDLSSCILQFNVIKTGLFKLLAIRIQLFVSKHEHMLILRGSLTFIPMGGH